MWWKLLVQKVVVGGSGSGVVARWSAGWLGSGWQAKWWLRCGYPAGMIHQQCFAVVGDGVGRLEAARTVSHIVVGGSGSVHVPKVVGGFGGLRLAEENGCVCCCPLPHRCCSWCVSSSFL